MWVGCEIEWPIGGTSVQFMDRLGAWLVANAGGLEVRHRPGVDLEWKSRAPITERGHFRMNAASTQIKICGVNSPGWSDDPAAQPVTDSDGCNIAYGSEFATVAGVFKIALENATGRAWVLRSTASEYDLNICDTLFKPVAAIHNSSASSVWFHGKEGYLPHTRAADGSYQTDVYFAASSPVVNPQNIGYVPAGVLMSMPSKTALPVASAVPWDALGSCGQPSIITQLVGAWVDGEVVEDKVDYDLVVSMDARFGGNSYGYALPWPKPANWSVVL